MVEVRKQGAKAFKHILLSLPWRADSQGSPDSGIWLHGEIYSAGHR